MDGGRRDYFTGDRDFGSHKPYLCYFKNKRRFHRIFSNRENLVPG